MSEVNCEPAKDLVRMRLFEKNLSLFKEIAIFSIISFKKGSISIVKYCFSFFWDFWCSSNCMGLVDCESVKDLISMRLFERSCNYVRKLQFSL